MTYLLLFIALLTFLFFVVNRVKGKVLVCPICAATVLTWVGALVGRYLNLFAVNNLFLAILIGISLGASTEKYGNRFGLFWKVSMVLIGGPAIYYLIQNKIAISIYLLLGLLFFTVIFSLQFSSKPTKGAYKDTFKDCCN